MFDAPISPFIAALLKAELHMHLEGSLEPETIMTLAANNRVPIPYADAAALRIAAAGIAGINAVSNLLGGGLMVSLVGTLQQATDSYGVAMLPMVVTAFVGASAALLVGRKSTRVAADPAPVAN